ncbi:MAG: site-specific integrase [Oscillospiraceae bacterium]|nr:site-specific integrase [Oscillospiraceae bacterium]
MAAKKPGNVITFPAPQKQPGRERYKKRADGRYQTSVRYTDADGQPHRKFFYGETQTQARQQAADFRRALQSGQAVDDMDIRTADWVTRFLALRRAKDARRETTRTYDTYRREAQRLTAAVGSKRLRDIRTSDIQTILNARAGLSKNAIRCTYAKIRQIFEVARFDRIITYNPCDGCTLPTGSVGSHRALDPWERDLITSSWQGHRTGLAAMIMLYAGLRRGEVTAINWSHINLSAGVIRVTEAVAYQVNAPIQKSTKTIAGVREVPIVKPLRDALEAFPEPRTGYLWPSAAGVQLTESACKRAWQSYITYLSNLRNGCSYRWAKDKSAWVPVGIRTHDLRHTYCTMLYDAGVDVKRAQSLMGHKDLAVTMGIYTHLSDARKQKSDDLLHAYFEKDVKPAVIPSLPPSIFP